MPPPECKSPPVVAATEGPKASTGKGLNGKDSTRTVSDYSGGATGWARTLNPFCESKR